MNMYFHYPIVFILIFLFVTQVRLPFFTFPVFYFISLVGFILLVFNVFFKKTNRFYVSIIFINTLLILTYLISYLINQQGDFLFLREIILFNFLSIFFIVFFEFYIKKYNISMDFTKVAIVAVFVQMSISVLAYISPSFFNIVFGLFPLNLGLYDLDELARIRMVVLGTPFFGSAVMGCIMLIWFADYIAKTRESKNLNLIMFLFLSIFLIIGARTNIFGVIFSLIVIMSSYKGFSRLIKGLLLILIFYFFFQSFFLSQDIQDLFRFGFEIFINYNDSQASSSVDGVFEMLKVVPNNFQTWLIGDAYFKSYDGYSYYKEIDIGFLRVIFNNGLIGLALYIYLVFYMLYKVSDKYLPKKTKHLIFLVFFILMVKGLANIFPYIMLIYVLSKLQCQLSSKEARL